jgi:hypothetical protein
MHNSGNCLWKWIIKQSVILVTVASICACTETFERIQATKMLPEFVVSITHCRKNEK